MYLLIVSAFICARSLANAALCRKRSGKPFTCCHISAFYFTGCGLHCRKALLPRDRKTAPECALSEHDT
ncbi:hypothetical protein EWK22_10355 [Salmonella enterica subsp. enterica serovar Redba]|nr:hypothetical protein [Salmonella enterica subsp. enterica serovar Redba]